MLGLVYEGYVVARIDDKTPFLTGTEISKDIAHWERYLAHIQMFYYAYSENDNILAKILFKK